MLTANVKKHVTAKPPPHCNHFTALFPGPPGEQVPEENVWTSWCKGRLTEADTLTIRLDATLSVLTSAHLHHPHNMLVKLNRIVSA